MTDFLHSIRLAIAQPFWVQILALVFVALSPLVVKKWRRKMTWHKADE
jgi:hypothetical protein